MKVKLVGELRIGSVVVPLQESTVTLKDGGAIVQRKFPVTLKWGILRFKRDVVVSEIVQVIPDEPSLAG